MIIQEWFDQTMASIIYQLLKTNNNPALLPQGVMYINM